MIVAAIGIAVIAAMSLGIFIQYDAMRSEVADERDRAAERRHDRLSERLGVTLNSTHLVVDNDWSDDSEIRSVVITCDDGRLLTVGLPAGGRDRLGSADTAAYALAASISRAIASAPGCDSG